MKIYLGFCLVPALLVLALFQQAYTLKGLVTDDTGQPVIGASVMVKGTRTGVAAGAKGEFVLDSLSGKETLVVSAAGYKTKEIRIKNRKQLNIILAPAKDRMEEVVVVALAGSRAVQTSLAPSQLQGRVYGLQVTGAAAAIRLRGIASVAADNKEFKREPGRGDTGFNTEGYEVLNENPFLKTTDHPLSTFSIDVDAASYSNVRRFINDGELPPAGAVRTEEMINYFRYDYAQPTGDEPFNTHLEAGECPWNRDHQLVMIGIQGRKIPNDQLPPSNLVFLIDVSGSMQDENKLPLVQSSMKLLADQLRPQDKVAIVVYAGSAGLVLPSTGGNNKMRIKSAIDNLEAGGSTAGGEGIRLAYQTARQNFLSEGNNRVILCTDGDFNVGLSSDDALVKMIENERKSGVFLTVLGYGMGNYQDAKMQKLADKGNGNHAYIDNLNEARKVLVKEAGGTLYTIAKDVKLQVEFNPLKVQGYRLIGYENRLLANEDFNDDTKDAGELGSGHTVTALYEIIPVGIKAKELRGTDSLRYQIPAEPFSENPFGDEFMFVKIRYKRPTGERSRLASFPLTGSAKRLSATSENFRFAAAVAQFGLLLVDSRYKGTADFDTVYQLGAGARGSDAEKYRMEFLDLVKKAKKIKEGL